MDGFLFGIVDGKESVSVRSLHSTNYATMHTDCKYSYLIIRLVETCIIVSYNTNVCNFQNPGSDETYLV